MKRATDKDEFGNVITYDLPDVKKCPVCRSEATGEDIELIKNGVEALSGLRRTLS